MSQKAFFRSRCVVQGIGKLHGHSSAVTLHVGRHKMLVCFAFDLSFRNLPNASFNDVRTNSLVGSPSFQASQREVSSRAKVANAQALLGQ